MIDGFIRDSHQFAYLDPAIVEFWIPSDIHAKKFDGQRSYQRELRKYEGRALEAMSILNRMGSGEAL